MSPFNSFAVIWLFPGVFQFLRACTDFLIYSVDGSFLVSNSFSTISSSFAGGFSDSAFLFKVSSKCSFHLTWPFLLALEKLLILVADCHLLSQSLAPQLSVDIIKFLGSPIKTMLLSVPSGPCLSSTSSCPFTDSLLKQD